MAAKSNNLAVRRRISLQLRPFEAVPVECNSAANPDVGPALTASSGTEWEQNLLVLESW